MDINLDDLNSKELFEELEKAHKEMLATYPNYKGSETYLEMEEQIKENQMLQDAKNAIDEVERELASLTRESKIPKSLKKAFKTHRAELIVFCHQIKKLDPNIGEPLRSNADDRKIARSIYHLKAKMTIRKIDKLL